MDKVILHCDLNNFYASVEERQNPSLRGHPIAVCGDPEKRHGIVLAKNMPAKACGVATGDTLWQAKAKCPDIVFVPPSFEIYSKVSKEVFNIYTTFTDRVESFGMDECWLDVTGSVKLFGTGKEIADKIREKVKQETGLTVSVGVSFTKSLAKLGSDMKKPDATTVLDRETFREKCYGLPVRDLIMVGRNTAQKLALLKINTIGDLAAADIKLLEHNFGAAGVKLWRAANGLENEEVRLYYQKQAPKSVSAGTTTPRDMVGEKDIATVVFALSENVAARLRKLNATAGGVYVGYRTTDFNNYSRQTAISPSSGADDIAKVALELLRSMTGFTIPIRAITVGAFKLSDQALEQLSLFDDGIERKRKLDECIDKIREKYGNSAIKRGITLESDLLTSDLAHEDYKPFKK
jgi:DNA polymerase-4